MALTTVTLHGEILDPSSGDPAVGSVQFIILHELRDVVDNIIYSPTTYTATLDLLGEFTIVLPATDNPDITPVDWVYKVWVNTDVWQEQLYIQLPFAPGVTEFADLVPVDFDPCTGLTTATPITPSEADLFVLKTGDTMTGNLIINANLQVSGDANVDGTLTASYEGISGDVMRLLSTALSTGLTSGGAISVNVNPALIDVAAATGWIDDYDSTGIIGPANPALTYVSFAGQAGIAPLPGLVTYWLLDSAATVVTQATLPTRQQTRTHIFLGASVSVGGVVIAIRNLPMVQSQPGAQLVDLMTSLGAFNVLSTGNQITANGVNLNVNTNGGELFIRSYGINAGDYQNPHVATLDVQAPATFRYATATSLLAPFVNTIDVANYDPGGAGVVTPIGGGANTATTHRVFIAGSPVTNEQIIIQYGQTAYSSLANARAAIGSGTYTVNPLFTGTLTGYIVAIRTATDLSNVAQATFVKAAKFAAP